MEKSKLFLEINFTALILEFLPEILDIFPDRDKLCLVSDFILI